MRFGTRHVKSLYRSGSLTSAAKELTRYKLDLVGVQWLGEAKRTLYEKGFIFFFLWKRKQKSSIENRILCTTQNSISS
jgi:hypothetical protein